MFVVQTGNTVVMGIQFAEYLKRRFQTLNGALDVRAQLVEAVLVRLNYLLSDFVIVWRAWSLAAGKPQLRSRYVLSICLFASFVFHIDKVVVILDGGFTLYALSIQHGKGHPLPLDVGNTFYRVEKRIFMPVCLFITNVVATSYIGIIIWEFLNATRGFLEPSTKIITFRQTLYLMFESGLLYSVIWVVIFFDIVMDFSPTISIFLGIVTPQITAIYPSLNILLTATQKSVFDESRREILTCSAATFPTNRPNIFLTQVQDIVDTLPHEAISLQNQSLPRSSA
ncbi:hypothetical protein GYMLUDRAFT_56749 [Collybiopsis luxurians FD-317 M1]|nr:hypothetical protein GYMLUDRAFT_56749 [Collybiopsis luxurians FD-317 M1]